MRAGCADPGGEDLLEPARRAFAGEVLPEQAEWVKRTRLRAVVRVRLRDGVEVFVKRDREPVGSWPLRRSRARREQRNLLRLLELGIAAVEPLGCWEERRGDGGRDGFLATRALPGARPLSERLGPAPSALARAWLCAAARIARRLHDAGLWHRDLHPGNILVAADASAGGERLVLVDVQKLRRLPGVPRFLRVRDLAMLLPGSPEVSARVTPAQIAEAYLGKVASREAVEGLAEALQRAGHRRLRARLRSRGRRCVLASTGFRVERSAGRVVYRRADVPPETVLAGLEGARDDGPHVLLRGGPPPGPAPSPFVRGQGAPEPGAPACAAVRARCLPGGWPRRHPGMRAWRNAHALLLRGFDTLTPLALVEERGRLWVRRSTLLTRREELRDPTGGLPQDPAGARAAVRELGRTLARLHDAGIACPGGEPPALRLVRGDPSRIVVEAPEDLRVGVPPRPAARAAALATLARTLSAAAPSAGRDALGEALLAGYGEAAPLSRAVRGALERARQTLRPCGDPARRIR